MAQSTATLSEVSLPPLKITCTSTDCESGLHCFRQTRRMKTADQRGQCRSCGADLIDWSRVHARNLQDIDYVFTSLRLEMFRHHYWHVVIDDAAMTRAMKKGSQRLTEDMRRRIAQAVGPADPPFDGRQTPLKGNVLYYAQHAVGACCRKCVDEWHGISMGVPLSEEQIDYLAGLGQRYLEERAPELFVE